MWVVASTSLSVMMQSMWFAACMALLGMKQSTGWRKIRMVGFGVGVINLWNLERDWSHYCFGP